MIIRSIKVIKPFIFLCMNTHGKMMGLEKTLTILSGTDHVLSQMLKNLIVKEGFLNFMSNTLK
ncbi:hypothetical protein [Thermoanaerobacterium thermosaccharolyticum]